MVGVFQGGGVVVGKAFPPKGRSRCIATKERNSPVYFGSWMYLGVFELDSGTW